MPPHLLDSTIAIHIMDSRRGIWYLNLCPRMAAQNDTGPSKDEDDDYIGDRIYLPFYLCNYTLNNMDHLDNLDGNQHYISVLHMVLQDLNLIL